MVLDYKAKGAAASFHLGPPLVPAPVRYRQILMEGPRDTGKSFGVAHWAHRLHKTGPRNLRGLIVRRTLQSLRDSVQVTFEEKVVARDEAPWRRILDGPGRENRRSYHYPNGSYIALGGLDRPDKWLSSEWDWIWGEEAREFSRRPIDALTGGLRNNALGWHCLVLTTNPGNESSWLNKSFPPGVRFSGVERGSKLRLLAKHEDNPYCTPERLSYLRELQGAARRQFYLGEWCGEEGLVWPQYDAPTHLLDMILEAKPGMYRLVDPLGGDPINLVGFAASMDFGYRHAACFGVWGFDREGAAYLVAECYAAGMHQEEWARTIEGIRADLPFQVLVCDSEDPRFIDFLNDHLSGRFDRKTGRIAVGADKSKGKMNGLDAVRWALACEKLYFLTPERRMRAVQRRIGGVWHERAWPDQELVDRGRATCATDEIPSYVFPDPDLAGNEEMRRRREKLEKPAQGCDDHGCDMIEYLATWAFGDRRPTLRLPKIRAAELPDTAWTRHMLSRGRAV